MHSLRIERDGAVAHLILTGPGKGNAMGPATWTEIPAALDELEADPAIRALVVRGHGEHFSFGLDVKATVPQLAGEMDAYRRRDLHAMIVTMQNAFTRIATSRLPAIAAVHGWCIGAGIELIAACDIRYAHIGAKFSLREVQLAIVPDLGGLARLPLIVGEGHTRELALTGKTIDAPRAAAIGLVNEVVDHEEVEGVVAHAAGVAAQIATYSPLTVAGIKSVMNAQQGRSVADGLAYVATWNAAYLNSPDLASALVSFNRG
jgi:enoyl-CoA hydratase